MEASPERDRSTPRSRLRLLAPLVFTTLAILWGGYESVTGKPAARDKPRALSWIARYEALREPLAGARVAIYFNAPEVNGKFRYFRAQYVLTPTTLVLRRHAERLLTDAWPSNPLIVDYRKARDLKPFLEQLRRRTSELGVDVEIRDFGKGLALIQPREPR